MLRQVGTLNNHDDERVWFVAWSPDGRFLASAGADKIIRVWASGRGGDWIADGAGTMIATLEEGQSRTIRSLDWSQDGRCIASASFDGIFFVEMINHLLK